MITRLRLDKDIKPDYVVTLMCGYVVALLTLIVTVRADFRSAEPVSYDIAEQEIISMEEIAQTVHIEKPPPPPTPPVPVEVPNDTELEDVELELDVSLDMDVAMALPPPPPPIEEEQEDEIEIFIVAEKMPEIIGGLGALYKATPYPEIAKKAGMEGQVVLRTTITMEGVPTDIEIIRSAGAVLDKAAVDGLSSIRFTPGLQRGKPVMVRMNVPIRFRLEN